MPTEHDPFAPHYTVGGFAAPAGAFPADRLTRAGLHEDHVDHLRQWFDSADAETRDAWLSGVESAPDQAIAARFAAPEGFDLAELKKDQLEEVLRARGESVTGNKADLISRVTETAPSEPAGGPETPAGGEEPQPPAGAPQIQTQAPGGPVTNEEPTEPPATPGTPEGTVTGAQQPPDPLAANPEAHLPEPDRPATPEGPSHEPPVSAPAQAEHRRSTRRTGGTGQGTP